MTAGQVWSPAATLLAVVVLAGFSCSRREVHVAWTVETEPVPSAGDAADDPAFWLDPKDPSRSTIIGTDKHRGLGVYDLSGAELQFLPDGQMNNVDVRDGFPLGGQLVALVTASNRGDDSIAIYRVDPATRMLENVAARKIITREAYGSCMYRSRSTNKVYYFVTTKADPKVMEQWELFDDGAGRVDARKVRTVEFGSSPEACVADDELGELYVGLQEEGILRYGAEPDAGAAPQVVALAGWRGPLHRQVEGLALYPRKAGSGYLVASSQGSDDFVVYRRDGGNECVGSFEVVGHDGFDPVTHTDGIELVSFDLGPAFPEGVFIAQDNENDGANQNFKLVPWHAIAEALASEDHR